MRRKTNARILLATTLICMLALMHFAGIARAQPETIYIRADGLIDPPTAPIQRDGDIYTFTDNIYGKIVVERDNIIVDGDGYTLQGAGNDTGIDLANRTNVTIKKTHITEFAYGVHLLLSKNNTVTQNTFTGNAQRGILVSNSSNNVISRNRIVNNDQIGISLWISNTTTITSNNISRNGEDGISIGYSSFYNTIINNTISNNSYAGISIGFETPTNMHNLITGNNITDNSWAGIHTDHTSGNTFHRNNLDNTNQVVTVGATNNWDNGYPSGGNYWSDYTGQDSDGDGIGDTPYVINVDNQDNYPFMNPWTPQAYDIATVNVTPLKTVVGQGSALNINVTVTNQGSYTQTFNVTAYANTTLIETKTVTLENGNSTTITFTWNTTDFFYGNYTISATATAVPGETDTIDNTLVDGTVFVTIPGDIDGDGDVDGFDFGAFALAFGSKEGEPKYDPEADLDGDGDIDGFDFGIFAVNFGRYI